LGGRWLSRPFVDLCEHSAFGPRFSGSLYARDGNVGTLRTTDISADGHIDYHTMPLARLDLSQFAQHILRSGDLVITRSGRVGTAAIFENFVLPVLPGAFLIRFRLKSDVADPKFFRYYFNSAGGQQLIQSVATGSVQQNINVTSLHRLIVPVPPLSEQRRIAEILGSLEDKIELNRRMNETLDVIARAIFKSWFVDFDNIAEFQESDIGPIPLGWRVLRAGDAVRVCGGSTPPTGQSDFWGGDIAFATPKDLAPLSSTVLLKTARTITEEGAETISSGVLPPGTLLLSSRAPIGYLAISTIPIAVNQGFVAMICDGPVGTQYMLHWCQQNMELIVGAANGTTFLEISKGSFKQLRVIVPDATKASEYEAIASSLHERTVTNETESATLASLRDTLLPKLLSGEIPVRAAEIKVAEVV
jgi:type I restriction enzyme S subunit